MEKITDILKKKDFTVSVEIVPPRNGSDPDDLFNDFRKIKDKIDFVSVTKGAGGSLRGGTLPISFFVQQKFNLNAIAHFVCRERTIKEIENDLVDLHYFNIKNVLALRGDPPAGSKEAWDGDYKFAFNLVDQIQRMNNGQYIPRDESEEPFKLGVKTDFCMLVAGHPEDPIDIEISHMKNKIKAGADVIITQMIFSFEEYKNYVDSLRNAGITIPILPGIRPLRNIKQAESMENFFGLKIDNKLKEGLLEGNEKFSINYFSDFIKKLKDFGAPGVHLFILNDIDIVKKIIF